MDTLIDVNGQTNGTAPRRGTRQSSKKQGRQPQQRRVKRLTGKQTMALVLGSVAAALIFLSVYHLTCAVSTLTGSPLLLAVLLAVGIDLGLVASEVAEMVADGAPSVQNWSRCYMLMATIMSMVLNSYEFAANAPPHWFSQSLSIGFGLTLPPMIFVLARQAGGLWKRK